MPRKSYDYYRQISDYYEGDFFNNGITSRSLCINIAEYKFFLPYSMIIICDKVKDYVTGIKMYDIIFKYKYVSISQWYVTYLISNLKYFYKHVLHQEFFTNMNIYIELLRLKKFMINEELVKTYVSTTLANKAYVYEERVCENTTGNILIAILAKDKEFCLPIYLDCLYKQTYPRSKIHLYIRTNDNKDNTTDILKQFIKDHGTEYASVFFDESSISQSLKEFGHHEWNSQRTKILGKIRQDSIDYAKKLNAHYFVADCDNFIVPNTIAELSKNSENGVIAPMLNSNRGGDVAYSNYHYDIDKNGYLKKHELYTKVLYRNIKGLIEVPVVHCSYFINVKFLNDIVYDDESHRYEYVIFSHFLRKKNIPQLLDNRIFYGIIEFSESSEQLKGQLETVWKSYYPSKF
jgi:hypothetical protein